DRRTAARPPRRRSPARRRWRAPRASRGSAARQTAQGVSALHSCVGASPGVPRACLLSLQPPAPLVRGFERRPETPAGITVIQKRPPRVVSPPVGRLPKGTRYNPRRASIDERLESSATGIGRVKRR